MGQFNSVSYNHFGPSHHLDCNNCDGLHPRDGRSAGFKAPGTCLHSHSLNDRISFILFETKVLYGALRLIHAKTVVESDHNVIFKILRVKDLATEAVSLTAIVAAINSNRGIVALSGAVLDFALISLTLTPLSCSIYAKTAAA